MSEDIKVVASLGVNTGDTAKKVNEVKDSLTSTGKVLKGTSSEAGSASSSFGNLKKSLGDIPGPMGNAAKGAGVFNTALNLLKANPIIAVLGILIGAVVALFQPFKKMEGVSDALGKAFAVLSGVFNSFINSILKPLISGFVKLTELVTGGLMSVLTSLGVTTKGASDRFGELADTLDDLEDAERDSAIAMAASNRKLQEAREIAADANRPIKERITALKEAAKIEKEELDKVVEMNRVKASAMMQVIAMEMGARQGLIDKIRSGSIEQLKSARAELMSMSNVDKEKLGAIDAMIIAAEDAGAQAAKIAKKTNSQITSIEKEEASKQEAIRKDAEQKTKERNARIKEAADKVLADEQKALVERINRKMATEKMLNDISKAMTEENEAEKDQAKNARNEKVQADLNALNNVRIQKEQEAADKSLAIAQALADQKKQIQEQDLALAGQAVGLLNALAGKNKAVQKAGVIAENALGIAKIIISTNAANAGALANPASIASFGATAVPVIIRNKIAAALGIASTIAATAKALSAIGGGGAAGGGSSAGAAGGGVSAPLAPQPVQTATSLNAASINAVGNAAQGGTSRSYILDSDYVNSNERNSRLSRAARIG